MLPFAATNLVFNDFPLLVLKGIYHYWKDVYFSRGLKQMEAEYCYRAIATCCGWTLAISHHFETVVESITFVGILQSKSSFQGFLGGPKWISSIHSSDFYRPLSHSRLLNIGVREAFSVQGFVQPCPVL